MKTIKLLLFLAALMMDGINAIAQTSTSIKGDVNDDGVVNVADITEIVNIIMSFDDDVFCPDGNHPHMIDMGLPYGTKWACCNLGANAPWQYGGQYGWGETWTKSIFNEISYHYLHNGSFMDIGSNISGTSYDAATSSWGNDWCMPTKEQLVELLSNTTSEWVTVNGVNGYKLTSTTNGNSIFLPASGGRWNDALSDTNSDGYYWSSTLFEDTSDNAWYLFFSSDSKSTNGSYRYSGLSVRPVQAGTPISVGLVVSSEMLLLEPAAGSEQLSITCSDSWTASSNESWCTVSPASGTGDGNLSITVSENTNPDSRSATLTVTAGVFTKTITVTQKKKVGPPAGAEAIDLGLPSGTLWANMNVGASKPEEYGDHFAWGETTPKSEYDWGTYKWCNGNDCNESVLTKYCYDSYYGNNGFTDNLTELLPEDDAATANWGDDWCMPTKAQFDELISNTISEWTSLGGVEGLKLTGINNSKFIFLPKAHICINSNLNTGFDYWSSSLDTPCEAWELFFYYDFGTRITTRSYGLPVRPVYKK